MSWQRMLGHEAVVASFASAWKRGRLGHAYLFVGPKGVGKHTFAHELAKTILCENRRDRFTACDQCASCKLVDAGTHPDLFMVGRPEEGHEFPIHVFRSDPPKHPNPGLLEMLAVKPARGTRKVAIINDADDMNEEASNCFLKTLEEPPSGSLFLLIGGPSEDAQWSTILSRCQVIRFMPLPPASMKKLLQDRGITEAAHQDRLLQLAGGSPGQALALDDEEVWTFRKQLIATLGQDRIDPAATARAWMEFIENAGKESSSQRLRASLIFRLFIVTLETAMRLSLGATLPGAEATEVQSLHKLAEHMGEDKLLAGIERALEADIQVERRVQLVLIVEAFLDAICR